MHQVVILAAIVAIHAILAVTVVTQVVLATVDADADATTAVVKNAAGGNSGKTKIAATSAINVVIAATSSTIKASLPSKMTGDV